MNVFETGKYETPDAAIWSDGDWDGDGRFGSRDLVFAFIDGRFETGAIAVPEPQANHVLVIGLLNARSLPTVATAAVVAKLIDGWRPNSSMSLLRRRRQLDVDFAFAIAAPDGESHAVTGALAFDERQELIA